MDDGRPRRSGRHHRRAVDRRAGHAAHAAHLPHRWNGGSYRRADGAQVEGRGHDRVRRPAGRRHEPAKDSASSRRTRARSSSKRRRDKNAAVGARLQVPLGAILMVEDGDEVKSDQVIFTWDPYTNPIIADVEGTIRFVDIVEDESVSEELDELTGLRQRVIIEDREKKLHPHIEICRRRAGRRSAFATSSSRWARSSPSRTDSRSSPGHDHREGRPRSVQDARHHGRSAARRRAVRGAPSEGSGDDLRDRRRRAVRRHQARQARDLRPPPSRPTDVRRSTRRRRRSCTRCRPASTCACTRATACAPVTVSPRVRSIRTTFCGSRDRARCRSIC